uniref:Uncharacterized protein n=1 Tax=Kalanchoe fedtschenkoi TaxID=63787 RepID=A0A7N1A4P0_KALFE
MPSFEVFFMTCARTLLGFSISLNCCNLPSFPNDAGFAAQSTNYHQAFFSQS